MNSLTSEMTLRAEMCSILYRSASFGQRRVRFLPKMLLKNASKSFCLSLVLFLRIKVFYSDADEDQGSQPTTCRRWFVVCTFFVSKNSENCLCSAASFSL